MPFHPDQLLKQLQAIVPIGTREFCVGFSGGLDSTVLLHALVEIQAQAEFSVRAINVNHGLHPDAPLWANHCAAVCGRLGIPFDSFPVSVESRGEGIEAAARQARYGVFKSEVRTGEVLLTAHHADDQLETLLLALARGSGVRGLASMPALQPFGRGFHARPLMDVDRESLRSWATAQRLEWIEDASNQDSSFDRNYLRLVVVPTLRNRWPAIAHAGARSAQHLGEAAGLLDGLAEHDCNDVVVKGCVHVRKLESLPSARRRNVLRLWLRQNGARAPSTGKLASIEHDVLHAASDRTPCIECDSVVVRRHRELLYCTKSMPRVPANELTWNPMEPLGLPELGVLVARFDGPLTASEQWTVRFREGGESIAMRTHHQKLKHLLQEQNVLPWWRGSVPLIYQAEELIAVGDLWAHPHSRFVIRWLDRPDLLARAVAD
jgi:tRNA(Ile)-lysidine synthase